MRYNLGLPAVLLPSYITTAPNCRSPLHTGALFASRCADVKKMHGQIPGLFDVYRCSSGYWITAVHHAITCSFRSVTSILSHLVYTVYTYEHKKVSFAGCFR